MGGLANFGDLSGAGTEALRLTHAVFFENLGDEPVLGHDFKLFVDDLNESFGIGTFSADDHVELFFLERFGELEFLGGFVDLGNGNELRDEFITDNGIDLSSLKLAEACGEIGGPDGGEAGIFADGIGVAIAFGEADPLPCEFLEGAGRTERTDRGDDDQLVGGVWFGVGEKFFAFRGFP